MLISYLRPKMVNKSLIIPIKERLPKKVKYIKTIKGLNRIEIIYSYK